MTRPYIGADLSSEWIDIFHPATGECLQIPNTLRAIRAFVRRMQPDETLVFEATSSCDDRILRIVREEHTPFVRVNPAHAWHFARACNLPKTDKVDARMLSAFAAARNFAPQEPSSTARDRVAALVKRRRQLKDMEVQEKNRLKRTTDADLKRGIQSVLALFARQVAKLDAEIRQRLENEEEFAELNRVLRSVPGVGPVTAAVLIADMPELGSADRRAIASLAGLAPRAFESGKFKGKRRLGQGRRYVRKALYMAALSVIAQRKLFRASIESMKAAGKPAKTVVVAIARKLLTLLNILVTRNEIFSFEKITANPNPQ